MNPHEDPEMEAARAAAISAALAPQRKQAAKSVVLCLVILFVIFGLPRFFPEPLRLIIMTVGSAAGYSAELFFFPQLFRGRTGSLKQAYGILVFMWLLAACVTLTTMFGH